MSRGPVSQAAEAPLQARRCLPRMKCRRMGWSGGYRPGDSKGWLMATPLGKPLKRHWCCSNIDHKHLKRVGA